jgi:hypothetical protein
MKIETLRSDNGGECTSQAFSKFLQAHNVSNELTVPYTPQENGVFDRANRTIVEQARAMLHDVDLPIRFWAKAVSTAIYLKNRSPRSALPNGLLPQELWTGRKPSLSHL